MGCGYSFEVLRARLLYNEETRSETRTSIRKRVKKRIRDNKNTTFDYMMMETAKPKARYETVIEERVIEYGPHIPTLVKLIESGELL